MRVLVLGAGLQGAACAYDLLERTDAEVTVADISRDPLPAFLETYAGSGRFFREVLDIRDEPAARSALRDHESAVSALPYYFNFDAARLAVEEGVHFADLGGNTEIVKQQRGLESQARERGITIVPDCGLAPGMVNIVARDGIDHLDDTRAVRLYVGGLPLHPEPPLNYQIVYSLEGALDYYTTESWVLRRGRPERVEALTDLEPVEFPEPAGTLEAFHTAGGLSTMAWDYEGQIDTMEYKTLRYPGHVTIMKAIRDLGLLDTAPVQVGDVRVAPRDAFIATVDPRLRRPDSPDLVALRVIVKGTRGGKPVTRTYTLVDQADEVTGISAMMRTTAFSLSITTQMQVSGQISPAGVRPAYQATPTRPYLDALAERGIRCDLTES